MRDPPDLPDIVFEDDALIAFNKPSGLLTAPDRWDKARPNLMDLVHRKLSPNWFNVHRLDAETSGALLCAKTKAALDRVCGMFEARRVRKMYLAITEGVPREKTGLIRRRIGPDPRRPGRMRVHSSGRPAETTYEVVEAWREFALVRCEPLTGRMHQIRVHLAAMGCPIAGDALYGEGRGVFLSSLKRNYRRKDEPERPLIGRLALHAESLELAHPVSGKTLRIVAPLPNDFEVALKYLRKFG